MKREFATHNHDLPHRYSPPAFRVGKEKLPCECGRSAEDQLHHPQTAAEQAHEQAAEAPETSQREFG